MTIGICSMSAIAVKPGRRLFHEAKAYVDELACNTACDTAVHMWRQSLQRHCFAGIRSIRSKRFLLVEIYHECHTSCRSEFTRSF